MKGSIFFSLFLSFLILQSCRYEKAELLNKQWAHRVNTLEELQLKEKHFSGLEVDLIYSKHQNKLFVAHDDVDTLNHLEFREWLSKLKRPLKKRLWLDIKDLKMEEVEEIYALLDADIKKYSKIENVVIENYFTEPLQFFKDRGYKTILWVDDINWSDWEGLDTSVWIDFVSPKVERLQPYGISGHIGLFPLLSNTFSSYPVFYWNTPIVEEVENSDLMKDVLKTKNVEVVLVDTIPSENTFLYVFVFIIFCLCIWWGINYLRNR